MPKSCKTMNHAKQLFSQPICAQMDWEKVSRETKTVQNKLQSVTCADGPENASREAQCGQPKKKNWPRKKRMASWATQQQQITEAADGGARARTGADGAIVLNLRRGPGPTHCSRQEAQAGGRARSVAFKKDRDCALRRRLSFAVMALFQSRNNRPPTCPKPTGVCVCVWTVWTLHQPPARS